MEPVRRTFPRLVAALLSGLLLAGCSQSSAHTGGLGLASTTTIAPDPYAIPEAIDEAYVERVLAALEHIRAEVRREVAQTRSFSELSKERLHDIYDEPALSFQLQVFSDLSLKERHGLKEPPGDAINHVVALYTATPRCIVVDTVADVSAVRADGQSSGQVMSVVLMPASTPTRWNPTPWRMVTDGGSPISERGDPCGD